MRYRIVKACLFICFFAIFGIDNGVAQTPPCQSPATRDASWSPDGKMLVFDSGRDGNQELYLMEADGKSITRLTHTKSKEYYPFFSPDGSKIVFFTYDGGHSRISVVNVDGTNLIHLTDDSSSNADPDWSPDGSKIAFFSERDGNAEIYVMNADGSEQQRMTFTPADENTPAWSPDGQEILFISNDHGNADLYVMSADGNNRRRITTSPLSDRVARWSPDGTKMVFYSREHTSATITAAQSWAGAEIYTINDSGGERTRLTHNNYREQSPVFSPDGTKIAYSSCASGRLEIHVMDADGTNDRQLTSSGESRN